MSRSTAPRPTPRQLLLDGGIALLLGGLVGAGTWLNTLTVYADSLPPPTWATYVSGGAIGAVLAVRRFVPMTTLIVCTLVFGVYRVTGGLDGGAATVALFLAITWVGLDDRSTLRNGVRAMSVAAMMGLVLWSLYLGPDSMAFGPADLGIQAYSILLNVFFFAAAWMLGDQLRLRREREASLAARSLELEAERERSAERAVIGERLRIARELHDVLGHHVSVMGVQAAAARRVLDRAPDKAAVALGQIEGSSRQAVTELQRVLALLREADDDPRGTQPAPVKLAQVAADMRAAGVEVTIQADPLPELPASLDLAVTRVVQESLTNVLRHGGPGTSAWVRVRARGGRIDLEVVDDGAGDPTRLGKDVASWSTGSGLIGMRERVELHEGGFEAGPVAPRGYAVRAWLPLPEETGDGAAVPGRAGETSSDAEVAG